MRIKTIMTACLAVPALSVLCLLSSCSSEELPTTEKPSTGTQTLTLNLKPAGTRAAVYTDPGTAAENTINSVTIGIFDQAAGNAVKTIQEVAGSTSPKITTSQLVAGDIVLVAVNAKAGTFTGAKNLTEFENKTLAIDDALANGSGSSTTVASSNLPMFGTGVIAGLSTTFTAAVDVYHMVSKITLRTLSVNFSATGAYSAATFTPTAVFMSNVPAALDFYPANTMSSYSTFATPGTLQQGEFDNSSNLKAYLGTASPIGFTPVHATLSGENTGSTYNWGIVSPSVANILYLYTMPSSDATSTRLVIRGDFDPDGAGSAPAVKVYYPVNINYNSSGSTIPDGGTVAKQIYPNKNYILDVTIQGKGSSSPTTPIDPQTATANITVKDFTPATQSNVFN